MNGSEKTYLKRKMCMIGTGKSNNEIMIMHTASMICDTIKEFKLIFSLEDCLKFCSYGIKSGLNHPKRQDVAKFNRRNYNLQKIGCSIH